MHGTSRSWPGPSRRVSMGLGVAVASCVALLAGCASSRDAAVVDASSGAAGEDSASQFLVVDCLLPPQLIRIGDASVRMLPSRPAKLSARLCAQQGGAQAAGMTAWKALADSGNAEAQTYLGEMFENGIGGAPRDLAKAVELYTKAQAAGNARAASNLALLYANGANGLPRNLDKARAFTEQATLAAGLQSRTFEVVPVASARPTVPEGSGLRQDLKQFQFGSYRALVIGISDYRHAPRLKSPTNEVDVIASVLERKYGFSVVRLKNATRDQILRKLDDLDQELKEGDNLLLYFTGHGMESASREGYWIPVDGEAPSSANTLRTAGWISSSAVREKLSVMKPRHVLVVADSCYSARFLQFKGVFKASTDVPSAAYLDNFAKLYKSMSRTALTSGGLAPVLDATDGSNMSLFAKAFVRFLERNRDPVPSVQLFAGIELEVMNGTAAIGVAQQPQWGPITGAGHESGDFWFRPK